MFKLISKIVNLGVEQSAGTQGSKVKVTNIASLIACVIPVLYGFYYYSVLGSLEATAVNAFSLSPTSSLWC